MTHKEKLQAVEKKIREVCTELQLDTRGLSDSERVWEEATATPTVHLEHVLRAIKNSDYEITTKGQWRKYAGDCNGQIGYRVTSMPLRHSYNLSLSLADQSEPTIAFLYEVIFNEV